MTTPFDPTRSDPLIHSLLRAFPNNPVVLALAYSAVSFGGTVVLALLWGHAVPSANTYVELFEDHGNIINFGIILPIAIVLVASFYGKVESGFLQIIADGVVNFGSESIRDQYLSAFDRAINHKALFWLAGSLALVFNAVFIWGKEAAWNDLFGGPPSYWFRLFAFLNYYIMFHFAFKALVVVRYIRRLFLHEIAVQPLHPDGCGGLKSLGEISMSMNYLVCLVAAYIAVMAFVGRTAAEHPFFIPLVVAYVILALFFLFYPLTVAHDVMSAEKKKILTALNREFQATYITVRGSLGEKALDLKDAQKKFESLDALYRIASAMPVWPLDTRIYAQFLAAVALPLAIGLLMEYLKAAYQM